MKLLSRIVLLSAAASFIAGCATTQVPREMKLADPSHRVLPDHPGDDVDAIKLACAKAMLNASPADEAKNIDVRVVSTGTMVAVDVDADLQMVGLFRQTLPVTFHCEYEKGWLRKTNWTRGLK